LKVHDFDNPWILLLINQEFDKQMMLSFLQEVLDSVRASNFLNKFAPKLRRISFKPRKNLHNICQFQRIMTKYCDFYGPLPDIECFSYTFPCDFARKNNEVKKFLLKCCFALNEGFNLLFLFMTYQVKSIFDQRICFMVLNHELFFTDN